MSYPNPPSSSYMEFHDSLKGWDIYLEGIKQNKAMIYAANPSFREAISQRTCNLFTYQEKEFWKDGRLTQEG